MMWDWGSGYGLGMSIVGTFMMLLVWGGGIALVIWALRAFSGPRQSDSTTETLRRRLAAGQITPEEYERTRKALLG